MNHGTLEGQRRGLPAVVNTGYVKVTKHPLGRQEGSYTTVLVGITLRLRNWTRGKFQHVTLVGGIALALGIWMSLLPRQGESAPAVTRVPQSHSSSLRSPDIDRAQYFYLVGSDEHAEIVRWAISASIAQQPWVGSGASNFAYEVVRVDAPEAENAFTESTKHLTSKPAQFRVVDLRSQ
ncbi:MAG TPA: hypothetical protein VJB57_03935 [Dehalococcoidia bacterium]|nr:hypothetical protein [Dehalococcoidia bacterium]